MAGTGNPYFTTDTAAALRAVEIGAEVLLKATKVDGVYDADPMTHPDAQRYDQLDYADLLRDRLKVLDATAVSLCMENDLPIVVFDLNQPDNITRVAAGEPVGTLISGAGRRRRCASMSTEIIADAEHKMARAVEAMERDFQAHPDRPRVDGARRAHPRRVLRDVRRRSTSWPGSASRSRTRSSSSRGTGASSARSRRPSRRATSG